MTVVVFGGNGFVGCKIMQHLVERDIPCTSVSRSGHRPVHLEKESWADEVEWVKGDASAPDPALFEECSAVIALVGSPPVPTFSSEAYKQQVYMNGETNKKAIEAAANAGVKNLVLLSADVPPMLQKESFGYYVGKQMAFEAAKHFVEEDETRHASVLRPSSIYGTRHTKNGLSIPLAPIMYPMRVIISAMPETVRKHMLPVPVSVEQVASVAVAAALNQAPSSNGFTVWENEAIVHQAA